MPNATKLEGQGNEPVMMNPLANLWQSSFKVRTLEVSHVIVYIIKGNKSRTSKQDEEYTYSDITSFYPVGSPPGTHKPMRQK
jgi:hypothetical protein